MAHTEIRGATAYRLYREHGHSRPSEWVLVTECATLGQLSRAVDQHRHDPECQVTRCYAVIGGEEQRIERNPYGEWCLDRDILPAEYQS